MYSSMSENESSVEISFGVEIEIIVWTWTWMDVRVPVKNNKHTTKHRAWGSGRWSGYRVLLDTVNACCWSRLAWTKKKKDDATHAAPTHPFFVGLQKWERGQWKNENESTHVRFHGLVVYPIRYLPLARVVIVVSLECSFFVYMHAYFLFGFGFRHWYNSNTGVPRLNYEHKIIAIPFMLLDETFVGGKVLLSEKGKKRVACRRLLSGRG